MYFRSFFYCILCVFCSVKFLFCFDQSKDYDAIFDSINCKSSEIRVCDEEVQKFNQFCDERRAQAIIRQSRDDETADENARAQLYEDFEAYYCKIHQTSSFIGDGRIQIYDGRSVRILPGVTIDQLVARIFLVDFVENKRFRVSNGLILCAQEKIKVEKSLINMPDSLVTIKDGLLIQNNEPLCTDKFGNSLWIMDYMGGLHVRSLGQHSYFVQNEEYIGLPIACGGHITVIDGKITFLNNGSGHYMPSVLQLGIVYKKLFDQGVISDDIKIQFVGVGVKSIHILLDIIDKLIIS